MKMRSGEDVFTFATHVKRVDIPLNYFHNMFLRPHIFPLCVHLLEEMKCLNIIFIVGAVMLNLMQLTC